MECMKFPWLKILKTFNKIFKKKKKIIFFQIFKILMSAESTYLSFLSALCEIVKIWNNKRCKDKKDILSKRAINS